jgi:DnaK suppressor protein
MDPERARQLLQQERERIEALLADLSPQSEGEDDPGDEGSETLYQEEFDATRAEDLKDQLAAVERAEARLAEGSYGRSIVTGDPIPDERLELVPTAERNIGE